MDRTELIKQAIAQCDKDITDLQQQRTLLLSSLKPVVVKKNGTKPAPKPPPKPASAKSVTAPTAEEIQSVLECFGDQALSLGSFEAPGVLDAMPKAKLRACLDALVNSGDVVQHGNRRSLCWVKSGAVFGE